MTLERGVLITDLQIGDIVSPEGRYITNKGFYYQLGRGFRVKRINHKSVTFAPLVFVNNEWIEEDTIRIEKIAEERGYIDTHIVTPRFGRDNSRCG